MLTPRACPTIKPSTALNAFKLLKPLIYRTMSNPLRRSTLATLAATALGLKLGHRPANADEFPSKPIRLVMGFPPGGSGDTLARAVGVEVSRLLGQTVVMDNRPGAGTNLASELVARAAPDGYTLLLGGSFSHSVNPALFAKLPYDAQKDFIPIVKVGGSGASVFVVPNSLPVNTLQEFIDYAKKAGDSVSYASSGIGSPGHIAGAYFAKRAGLSMTHIPYKGAGEVIRDLVSGQFQLSITSITSVLPIIRDKRVKALAMSTPARSKLLPEVPGSAEAGLVDFDMDGWYGVFAPAGTPPAVVAKIYDAFKSALQTPAVVDKLEAQGIASEPVASSEAFAGFVRANARRWYDIVKQSGATVQ
jgi:tripartite-type tricarboxylate transporter receptor subunit TctC